MKTRFPIRTGSSSIDNTLEDFYPPMIRNCQVSAERLAPLRECMVDSSGANKPGEWPGNFFSTQTVAYSCGILARAGETIVHAHDPAELALCQRLANEAARIMAGTYLGMADESDHQFSPFFITANVGAPVPPHMTESAVRTAFRGIIWPQAQLEIDPLKQAGKWWQRASGQPLADNNLQALKAWRGLLAWFAAQPELHAASFVGMSERGASSCIFPQMALAFTSNGSLVGLFGCVVWT